MSVAFLLWLTRSFQDSRRIATKVWLAGKTGWLSVSGLGAVSAESCGRDSFGEAADQSCFL
jgi:hypothetical protein